MPRLVRTEEYIATALEELGHEVHRVQVPPYLGRLRRIGRLEPDVILVHHSREMSRRWVKRLKAASPDALVVQWLFDHLRDWGWEEKWFLPRARVWDLSFLKDRERFPYYQSEGLRVHWLHQGTPPGVPFGVEPDPDHACDVAFLGNPHHPFRLQVLHRIADEGYRVHIYTNPANAKTWRQKGFEHVFPNVHDADMAPVCASARFILGVGFFPDEWEGYWSSRPYLTLAAGGLFLTQYVRGMEEHFVHGRHLLWWRDVDECLELIRQYTPRTEEREKIRRAGYEHVHAHHSYRQRCAEFVQVCEAELERLRGGEARAQEAAGR